MTESTITTKGLMAIIGVGKTWLAELEKSGVIKRASGRNSWDKDTSIRGYISHLQSLKQTQPSIAKVSLESFGRHIGVSRERVRTLISEGVITPTADGKLDQDAARLAYLRHLRDRPVRSQSADKLREAKAREVELRMAERLHELIERDTAQEVVEDVLANLMVGLQGMAARIGGRDLALRRKIDDEIFRIRAEAANRLKAHAKSLRQSGKAARTGSGPISAAPSAP